MNPSFLNVETEVVKIGKRVKKKQRIRKRAGKKKVPKREKFERAVWKLYKVENGKVVRLRPFCPVCGSGVFLADHGDRLSCGRCGYTIWKKQTRQRVSAGKAK